MIHNKKGAGNKNKNQNLNEKFDASGQSKQNSLKNLHNNRFHANNMLNWAHNMTRDLFRKDFLEYLKKLICD